MKQRIHINQVGYICYKRKTAAYVGNLDSFAVVNAKTQRVLYSGTLSKPVLDKASGDMVRIADFSSFNMSGKYYIKIGMKKSCVFEISEKPYVDVKNSLIKGLYYNRCGCTLSNRNEDYPSNMCHCDVMPLLNSTSHKIDVSGGWHDSGNYGRYVPPACLALGYLLYAFKLFPESFGDSAEIVSENPNFPDILAEAKVELDWLLKMQAKDGGVYHKVAPLNAFEFTAPNEDKSQHYVFPKSHHATADFTACTALAASVFKNYDKEYAEKLKNAAVNSWIWLMNNPTFVKFENPPSTHVNAAGDFVDDDIRDDMLWASCELYGMTGDDFFVEKILELYKQVNLTGFSNCHIGGFASLAYLLCNRERNINVMSAINTSFRVAADNIDSLAKSNPYFVSKGYTDYILGSNLKSMRDCAVLIIANRLLGNDDYIDTVVEQFNYILGKNCLGMCFVTGIGGNSVMHPHHRPSMTSYQQKPVPGLLVGGPNSERKDEYAKWSIPQDTPPARCYEDCDMSFSTNEPAIYNNSAAIFVEAFLETL